MSKSDETQNERREKAIQLSIKMKREAFSNLARELAQIGHSVPPKMREFIEKDIAETPAQLGAFFRDLDAVDAKADLADGKPVERATGGKIKGKRRS